MNNIVIFGVSGHAKVIVDILSSYKNIRIAGFIDNSSNVGDEILGFKVLGKDTSLKTLMKKFNFNKGVIAIGDNIRRCKVENKIKSLHKNFQFINCIHKSAVISKSVKIGNGNIIMPGVVINTHAVVGNHCILNTNSSLDHDCNMKNFSSLGPNVAVAGGCQLKELVTVGIGATILQNIQIEKNCIIGAGSVVTKNTTKNSTYFGIPAKFIKKIEGI